MEYSHIYDSDTIRYQDSHVRGDLDYEEDPTVIENLKYITFEADGEIIEEYIGYGLVSFVSTVSEYGYWVVGDNSELNTSIYIPCVGDYCLGSYPAYVYDNNSVPKEFVDNYVSSFNSSISGASATGRLITYEELINLGCSESNECYSAPSWVYQTSYWTASAISNKNMYAVCYDGYFDSNDFCGYGYLGVRPVIEINASVITKA